MDATAQLALMVKAKLVFEAPETFLSFPIAPIGFPPDTLDFSKALSDPRTGATLLEYSRYVNQCPHGPIFLGDSDQYLWERYDQWLTAMDLAQDGLPDDREATYAHAHALLNSTDPTGLVTDSPAVAIYRQYRDLYLAALQAYKSAELTAENSQSSDAGAQWHDVDEPRLRDAVAHAQSDWETAGGKSAIEAAQAVVAACEARLPRKVWEGWRNAYNPDVDVYVDAASNQSCAPSGFAPGNLAAQAWTPFTLANGEIRALASQASAELRAMFGDTSASEVASLSFEFRSAAVVRPWFNSAVFDARFWKFANGNAPLSDGAAPPHGAWPAYVSAVVFARRIQATMAGARPQPVATLPQLALRPQVLQALRAQSAPPSVMRSIPAAAAQQTAVLRAPAVAARPVMAAMVRSGSPPPPRPGVSLLRLNMAATYRREALPVSHPPVAPQSLPAQPAPSAQPVDGNISILAFICRPLHKVPDPDPTLNWSA